MTNEPPAAAETTPPPLGDTSASETVPEANPFRYVLTEGFPELLAGLNCTLAATTYQAGKLVLFRADGGRVSALFRTFDSAMGMAVAHDRIAIGTRHAIWLLRNEPDIGRQIEPKDKHDACFVPRSSHITGNIHVHDLAWCAAETADRHESPPVATPQLWFVNTLFSCLCTLDPDFSFVPRWCPPFITAIVAEDRCHLNGLAVVNSRPAYVTALGMTDTQEGWRGNKAAGGVVIDVDTGLTITAGLAMPHSPRVHRGNLFVLNSGEATLEVVDQLSGKRDVVTRLPGYGRGLAFVDKYAFVGLSKIREKHAFGGLPIEQTAQPLKCGIACVDIETGLMIESIEFEADCEEIYDVQLIPSVRYPAVVSLQKDRINGVFVVAPHSMNAATSETSKGGSVV